MKMQSTYEEQQSEMADLIGQVALLTEMVREIQEYRAIHEDEGNNGEEGVIETTEGRSGMVSQEDQGAEGLSVEKEGRSTTTEKTSHQNYDFVVYPVDGGRPNLREDK